MSPRPPISPDPAILWDGEAPAFRLALVRWFRRNGRDLPWRRTRDPYAILVSELMLQQTQVATVIPYYARWLERFPDVASLARTPEPEVFSLWQGLGYYARARNLHRAALAVMRDHGGQIPRGMTELQALPGVGRYTAAAVAAFAFDLPEPLVDANIARVLARLVDLREPVDTARGIRLLWEFAARLQPARNGRAFNSALMELGALVCTPRKPPCENCPVRKFCRASDPEGLPLKKARPPTTRRLEERAWITDGTAFLAAREPGNRWRGLWALPRLDAPPRGEPLHVSEHALMHYRITLRVWKQAVRKPGPSEIWIRFAELPTTPMPAPHRRVAEALADGTKVVARRKDKSELALRR